MPVLAFYDGVFGDECGVDFDAESGAGGDGDCAVVVGAQRGGGTGVGQVVVELFELVIFAGVRDRRDEVHHVQVAEAGGGDVRDALLAERGGHARDSHAADHAADVEHDLVNDADRIVG